MKQETLNLLQTIILLVDKVPESEIMLKYGLYPYIKNAKLIINKFDL
jgi:hypothetical protein